MLYKGVNQLVMENLDRLAREDVIPAFPTGSKEDVAEQSDERTILLKALRKVWEDHKGNMSKLSDILKYLVRPPPHTPRPLPELYPRPRSSG